MDLIQPELADRAFREAQATPITEPRLVLFAFAPHPNRLILGPRVGMTHGDLVWRLRQAGQVNVEQIFVGFIQWFADEEPSIHEASGRALPDELTEAIRREIEQRN